MIGKKRSQYFQEHMTKSILVVLVAAVFLLGCAADKKPTLKHMTFEEYLEETSEEWFLTGKKKYTVQAMMVSKKTSFHNELEDVDYTALDDGETVVLKGVKNEMWMAPLM